MLRQEFLEGLRRSGKYDEDVISDVVPRIVAVTHDVRHKALIDRFGWAVDTCLEEELYSADPREIKDISSSTDISFLHAKGNVQVTRSFLKDLLPYAQDGCAYMLGRRLEGRKSATRESVD